MQKSRCLLEAAGPPLLYEPFHFDAIESHFDSQGIIFNPHLRLDFQDALRIA